MKYKAQLQQKACASSLTRVSCIQHTICAGTLHAGFADSRLHLQLGGKPTWLIALTDTGASGSASNKHMYGCTINTYCGVPHCCKVLVPKVGGIHRYLHAKRLVSYPSSLPRDAPVSAVDMHSHTHWFNWQEATCTYVKHHPGLGEYHLFSPNQLPR
jgi:hypothetical protein